MCLECAIMGSVRWDADERLTQTPCEIVGEMRFRHASFPRFRIKSQNAGRTPASFNAARYGGPAPYQPLIRSAVYASCYNRATFLIV